MALLVGGAQAMTWPVVETEPSGLLEGWGHVQGTACSDEAFYVADCTRITKFDWNGRKLASVETPCHTGDISFADGKLYAVISWFKGGWWRDHAGLLIRVYDADLKQLKEAHLPLPDAGDGCVVVDGKLYTCAGRGDNRLMRGHSVRVFDAETLTWIASKAIDYGQETHWGAQNMASDGKEVFLSFYTEPGVPSIAAYDLNFEKFRVIRGEGPSQGFHYAPKRFQTGEEPVFLTATPFGGAYGHPSHPADPKNPPRLRITFKCIRDGALVDCNAAAKPKAAPAKRTTLLPEKYRRLKAGSIRPEGWLKFNLDKAAEGLPGRYHETSSYLTPKNAWLTGADDPDWTHGAWPNGWEEQSYWFRSFVKLAIATRNERMLSVAREWIGKMLATADEDGWFGPKRLKRCADEKGACADCWPYMAMSEALIAWSEFTGERAALEAVAKFWHFAATRTDVGFLSSASGKSWHWGIQWVRAGDAYPVLAYLTERVPGCLEPSVFDRVRNATAATQPDYNCRHTVSFAERFAYRGLYARWSGEEADRIAPDFWYDLHMSMWGQMPRGAFAADELVREGCTDPRYGTETCTWGELMRSFQLLVRTGGDAKWSDRTEDVFFNHYFCAYTPDFKKVHYVTAPNQVMLDKDCDHDYANEPPQAAYSGADGMYRCCAHNGGLALGVFAESLVLRRADGGLRFNLYAPHAGETDGIRWRLETRYPFEETMTLSVEAKNGFFVELRRPAWAESFTVNGRDSTGHFYVPAGKNAYRIALGCRPKFTCWPRHGSVTVDRGPLSYSLDLGEKVAFVEGGWKIGGSKVWGEGEIDTTKPNVMTEMSFVKPWNYAIDTSAGIEEGGKLAWNDDCFTSAHAPRELFVRARRLPEWRLSDHQSAALQESPAYTVQPPERVRMIPLGCARLRLSVLPRGTDDPVRGVRWRPAPEKTERAKRPQGRGW